MAWRSHDIKDEQIFSHNLVFNPYSVANLNFFSRCTETGGVYTWGWKECVPSDTIVHDLVTGGSVRKDTTGKQNSQLNDQCDFFHLYLTKQTVDLSIV